MNCCLLIFYFQVYTQLSKLSISTSHRKLVNLIEPLGKDFDEEIKVWKVSIEDMMKKTAAQYDVCYLSLSTYIIIIAYAETITDILFIIGHTLKAPIQQSDDFIAPSHHDDLDMELSFQDESFLSSDSVNEAVLDENILSNCRDIDSEPSTPKSVASPPFSPICPSSQSHHSEDDVEPQNEDVIHNCSFPSGAGDTCELTTGIKIVFDNIDKNINPRFMTLDQGTKSLHYVQM